MVRLFNEEEFVVIKALQGAEKQIAQAAEHAAEAFQRGGRIIYIGSGTSGRVAAMDAAEMPPTFGIEEGRFIAIVAGGTKAEAKAHEHAEDDEHKIVVTLNDMAINPKDILIAVAASGRTPFSVAGIKHAKQKGVWTCGISNNPDTPLLKEADHAIYLNTGPEILTGSTRLKAGTSQKLTLNMISTISMVLSGKVIENLMADVKASNQKLKERCARIVRDLTNATFDEAWEMLEKNEWNVRKVVTQLNAAVTK